MRLGRRTKAIMATQRPMARAGEETTDIGQCGVWAHPLSTSYFAYTPNSL